MVRPKKKKATHDLQYKSIGMIPLLNSQDVCLEYIHLDKEELESLRLHDLLSLGQVESARRMNISQPTFHRLLASARKKLADALINGKEIKIKI